MPKRTNDGLKKRCAHKRKGWNDCACPWWFGFIHKGREYRYSLTKLALARLEEPPKSKDEAIAWRDRLRTEIRTGTFIEAAPSPAPTTSPIDTRLTFGDVCDAYLTGHVRKPTRREGGRKMMETLIGVIRRAEIPAANGTTIRLEAKPIAELTKADVEAVRTWRRDEIKAGRSHAGAKGGEAGINRLLSRLRHVFNWAIAEGHLTDTPFRRGGVTVVKLERGVEYARTRRLDEAEADEVNEGQRILDHADPHLRAVLVAALTTGCRIGEILSLQWHQIRRNEKGEARWIVLPPTKTKTDESARVIPVGADLRAVLSLRRHAPDGKEHARDRYVFGNAVGDRVKDVRRQWETAVLVAHGHAATRKHGKLTPESRAALQAINLHVHDLRREFASRLLESGATTHDIMMFLGHGDITTTSKYLRSTPIRLARALDAMERGAGSAQYPHTGTSEASTTTSVAVVETPVNSLN
ncbi:MAG TPA: site-specific integrase [Vicinamibacterales bacterium]|jgi:integrase